MNDDLEDLVDFFDKAGSGVSKTMAKVEKPLPATRASGTLNPEGLRYCFVAGGAVTSYFMKKPIADYDIYPKTPEGLLAALESLMVVGEVVNVTDRSISILHYQEHNHAGNRMIYQIIKGYYPYAEDIFENFDFSVCMGAYDCDSGEFSFGKNFLEDIASRTIHFNPDTKYPLASFLRVGKYIAKGFVIPKAESIRMAITLGQTALPTSWEELSSAVGGVYGKECEILAGDEEFSIDRAMELLSDMQETCFMYKDKSGSFKGVKAEDLFVAFGGVPYLFYLKIEDRIYYQNVDGTICGFFIGDVIPETWMKLTDDYLIRTYKYVDEEGDYFVPCTHRGTNVQYHIGKTTEAEKPWIYVGKNISTYSKSYSKKVRRCLSVLVKPSDVMAMSRDAGYMQAKRIFVESVLPEDEKPIETYSLLNNRRF